MSIIFLKLSQNGSIWWFSPPQWKFMEKVKFMQFSQFSKSSLAVCDKLEENKVIFKKRLYRQDCRLEFQSYTKVSIVWVPDSGRCKRDVNKCTQGLTTSR